MKYFKNLNKMKENEEKINTFNQNIAQKSKEDKENLHYKKIKIKIKTVKNDDIDLNYISNNNFDNLNKINFPENDENEDINDKEEVKDEKDNFMFEDINNQLDEILENIENDGIEEINKKIKLLNEDQNMFNTISYSDNKKDKDINFKKIDNKNKFNHKRNKIPSDKNNNIHINNNYKHFNQNNRHNLFENRNISNNTNNRYLFSSLYNTHRNWKEEDNCNNEDNDNYMNKTNISLFYKYNKYNFKKSDEE